MDLFSIAKHSTPNHATLGFCLPSHLFCAPFCWWMHPRLHAFGACLHARSSRPVFALVFRVCLRCCSFLCFVACLVRLFLLRDKRYGLRQKKISSSSKLLIHLTLFVLV